MAKLTVKDLFQLKGIRKLTQVYVRTPKEAAAAEAAGIDIILTSERNRNAKEVRDAAPDTFLTMSQGYGLHLDIRDSLKSAYEAVALGVDALYCPQSMDYVEALAKEGMAVFGHVGMVPYKGTWAGGFKAVGKTLDEALELYKLTMSYQNAGAVGVEMELVPEGIAAEISKRVKILTMGMGAGAGCDAQYLFSTDILGDNEGHVPRHAKTYRNHKADYQRLHSDSIAAFKEFKTDVESSVYPTQKHAIETKPELLKDFLSALDSKT